jgi:acyl-CoA thioester hydrolase
MRNTAFLDRAADVRMMCFAEHGFPMTAFKTLKLGPVVMQDEIEYFREIALLQEFTMSLALAGLSRDGSRFHMRNDIQTVEGKLCACVTSTGGWLDLAARRLVAPPEDLLAALLKLPRTEDFQELGSSLRAISTATTPP